MPKIAQIENPESREYCKTLLWAAKYRLVNYGLARYTPHPHQKNLHCSPAQIRLLYGANRMGKTFSGTREVCYHATGNYPSWWPEECKIETPSTIWCVIEDYKKSADTHRKYIEECIGPDIKKYPNRNNRRYVLYNGSKIELKTYKQNRKSFESASIDFAYLDEEAPLDIYNAVLARTIDSEGRILITVTPVEGAQWIHTLIEKSKEDDDVYTNNESIYANLSLTKDGIERVAGQYDDTQSMIRIHGQFVPAAGSPVFPHDKIEKMMNSAIPGDTYRVFWRHADDTDVHPIDPEEEEGKRPPDGSWDIHVWEPPQSDKRYIIGSDPGGTTRNASYSTAVVLDRETGKVVARYQGKINQIDLGRLLYALGVHYNHAELVVESNKGGGTIAHLVEENYINLYTRKKHDYSKNAFERVPGFHTTKKERLRAIANLEDAIQHGEFICYDERIIGELSTFVCDERGKQKAQYGCYDDLVIACALAVTADIESRNESRREEYTEILYDEVTKEKKNKATSPNSLSGMKVKTSSGEVFRW